jgi:hypothetical protein
VASPEVSQARADLSDLRAFLVVSSTSTRQGALMRSQTKAASLLALGFFALGTDATHAQIDKPPAFPLNTPTGMRGIEAACTGVSVDERNDPRWASYPLRVEVVNTTGECLSDEQITLTKNGEVLARVNCAEPWVLFKIAPGAYSVSAEIAGMNQESRVNVSGTGQARVILRFTEQ